MNIIEETGRKIEQIAHSVFDIKETVQSTNKWSDNDARISIFNKIHNLMVSMNTGYYLINTYLQKKNWWKEHQKIEGVTDDAIKNTVEEFEMFFRIGLVQNMSFIIESSFRIYVRAIDINACNGGKAEFKNIYEWLFKNVKLQEYSPLFDLWRNIRNTMHNNGLFMPANNKDQTIKYKSNTFKFEIGKPIDFVTTSFLVKVIPELLLAITMVISTSPVIDFEFIQELT